MRIAIAGATGLVGSRLSAHARAQGHDVAELARARGIDLVTGAGLDLRGVDAVVDVTQPASVEGEQVTTFFRAVARTLGEAATAAGVERTVVLSIIGTDRTAADSEYDAGKLAHEQATLEHAPGPRILRAAPFHELAGQMLGWYRQGDTAELPDLPLQPVELGVVVEVLLDMATGADDRTLAEVAGPRRERLVEMAARVDPAVRIVPVFPGAAARDGALLPGPGATIAGRPFGEWLAS